MSDDRLICMMCYQPCDISEPGDDSGWMSDRDDWCYCQACDVWTSHPPTESEDPME